MCGGYIEPGPFSFAVVMVIIAVPIALIAVARLRGNSIGKPWLVWLPVAALLAGFTPMMFGFVAGPVRANPAFHHVMSTLMKLAALAPIVLHAVCATLGGQNATELRSPN